MGAARVRQRRAALRLRLGITVSEEAGCSWRMTFPRRAIRRDQGARLPCGTDMLVGRLGVTGKRPASSSRPRRCSTSAGLLFQGSPCPRINWDVEAPVTGASIAIFTVRVFFAVVAGLLLLRETWRDQRRIGDDEHGDGAGVRGPGSVRNCTSTSGRLPAASAEPEHHDMTVLIFLGSLLGAMALGILIRVRWLLRAWRFHVAPGPVRRADPGVRTLSTAPTVSCCWRCCSSCSPARS